MRRKIITLFLTSIALGACTTTPGADALPDDETTRNATQTANPLPTPEETVQPVAVMYETLTYKGVRGGRITFETDGSPDEVLSMLLDFDHARGRRSWAKAYESLPAVDGRPRARWDFEGHMGINPSVVLEFEERRESGGVIVLRYKLVETAFGLGAFFGDYRIEPMPTARRSRVAERVFIDSGTWLANASAKDIEDGLREDARLIQAWMRDRTASDGQPDSP